MYQKDVLRDYIQESELRVFSNDLRVRLSKELAEKYDEGCYTNYFKNMQKYIDQIHTLGIQYPGNAKPVFYIYVVPDDCYTELLRVPKIFDKGNGGGKPVSCYDLDGFYSAYGISQNLIENIPEEETSMSRMENSIHELSHIVQSQFFSKNQILGEGFAETLSLYVLNLQEGFSDYKKVLLELEENKILTAQELLQSERDGTFGKEAAELNRSCSFRFSYLSSYLFVRSCVEYIEKKEACTKVEAIQQFLEIIKQSKSMHEWLIYDIANAIGYSPEKLLKEKELQLQVLEEIKKI